MAVQGPARVGIAPHAGWMFSGPTAGKVFRVFKDRSQPHVFILFSATHSSTSPHPVLYPEGQWDTPLGPVDVDADMAEVLVPFIKHLFPEARIVPVLVPPTEEATVFGRAAGRVMQDAGEHVCAVASTDLTHYGMHPYGFEPKGRGEDALQWVKQVNDRRFIDDALERNGEKILEHAARYRNACGAGAAAAAVTAAAQIGASGALLEYTTSHDVLPQGPPAQFVGYAGLVFCGGGA